MSLRITLAVAHRVLTQIRRDHRTVAMLLLLPSLLMTLLWWMFKDVPAEVFDRIGPGLLALFPFFIMFLSPASPPCASDPAALSSGCSRCRWASSTS